MLKSRSYIIIAGIGFILLMAGLSQVLAQGDQPTPLPISIPTLTPSSTPRTVIKPPTSTPTADVGWVVEARTQEGGANVRQSPSTDALIYKKVFPGQFFAVISRSDKWIQIQFPESDTGYAWVFEDVVKITGPRNPALIPTSKADALNTINPTVAGMTITAQYLTQTPGAPESATALQASATGVFGPSDSSPTAASGVILPTFTDPPPLVEATLPVRTAAVANQTGMPPIVPIIGLLVIGLVGLLISGLRRL